MSALLLLSGSTPATAGHPDTTPYAFPTSAPWNGGITGPTITPTDDGTGETIHPDVYDFGLGKEWNGYRYWMASTAFFQADPKRENPHIHGSHDGYTWEVPAGLTNPIDPWPGAATNDANWYNSDTDIEYEPNTATMIVYWREYKHTVHEIIWASTSTDGVVWSAPVNVLKSMTAGNDQIVSQSIVRVSATDWRMVTFDMNGGNVDRIWYADNPLGPFTNPVPLAYTGTPINFYHGNIKYHDGKFWNLSQSSGREYPGYSVDGINWNIGPWVLEGIAGTWQPALYRSTMTPHENGTHYRVWYTVHGDVHGRHVGYTQIPRSFWTSLA